MVCVGWQRGAEPRLHSGRGLRHRIESTAIPAVVRFGRLARTEPSNTEPPAW